VRKGCVKAIVNRNVAGKLWISTSTASRINTEIDMNSPAVTRFFYLKILLISIIVMLMQSCVSTTLSPQKEIPDLPVNFTTPSKHFSVDEAWLNIFTRNAGSTYIEQIVSEAMQNNQNIRSESYTTYLAEQQLIIAKSDFWPSLNTTFSAGRSDSGGNSSGINSLFSLGANLNYEVDVWGALSDAERQAKLTYLSALASLEEAKLQLAGNVLIAYTNASRAEKRVALTEQQVKNSGENLDIIERGYRAGLNESLDVYLARNELNSDISTLASNRQTLLENKRVLERLLGRYPSGDIALKAEIQLPQAKLGLGIPSQVVTRKPALQADWLALLAQDAALAMAHKARFPALSISAGIGNSSGSLSALFSNASAWSLLTNITAPVFNAGRLKAFEKIEFLRLQALEADYLNSVFNTLRDVENAISLEHTLLARFDATNTAKENAEIANQLSFEQYQAGLVSYTTVLEAQARLLTAQNNLIDITTDLIINRIDLHVALGAGANLSTNTEEL
jgi:NodT family efflux transporter outer membrane factor (OMF) lipoprotein